MKPVEIEDWRRLNLGTYRLRVTMVRRCLLMVTVLISIAGCSNKAANKMNPTINIPEDRTTIHPWIAGMLDADFAGVTSAINQRMSAKSSVHTAPLIKTLEGFSPSRIEFHSGVGYILCVKRSSNVSTGSIAERIYIAQPLPEEVLHKRVEHYDESVRPLMAEFFTKFAGCGEEKEGESGQFVLMHDAKASDIAHYEPEKLGDWRDARLLYAARNGDSVFINRSGATAWHVLETNQIVTLFDTFPQFIKHYAAFRNSPQVFDSWASREFMSKAKNP